MKPYNLKKIELSRIKKLFFCHKLRKNSHVCHFNGYNGLSTVMSLIS